MILTPFLLFLTVNLVSTWSVTDLQSHINSVKIKSFPELNSVRVSLEEVDLKKSFFATDVKNLFKFWLDREYVIRFHPSVLKSDLKDAALDAILAHELCHIVMYRGMSNFALVQLALQYHFGSEEFQSQFERATDLQTVERGYRDGLKDYRVWLYKQLSPEDVPQKKRLYLTPEELSKP